MNEFDIRKSIGTNVYDQGKILVNSCSVKKVSEPARGVEIFESEGHIVIYRNYGGRKEPLYDCDCPDRSCAHIASVMILQNSSTCEITKDDPAAIERIEGLIDNIANDVLNDEYYDEEANYYEDWEIEEYDIENNNEEIEYDYTYAICRHIVNEVKEPTNVILLFDRLHTRVDEDFEYDNGGFDKAFDLFDQHLSAAFHYATPEMVSELLSRGDRYSAPWAMRFIKELPKETYDAAYQIGKRNHVNSYAMLEEMFERGDYEDYVESSTEKDQAMLRVGNELLKEGEIERASRICSALADSDCNRCNIKEIAKLLSVIGKKEDAARFYYRLFIDRPCEEYMRSVMANDPNYTKSVMLDVAERRTRGIQGYDFDLLSFLTKNGRDGFVSELISSVGFPYEIKYGMARPDFKGACGLCESLADKGRFEESAFIARRIIGYRLEAKDSKSYEDGAKLLKFMDSRDGFEDIDIPHSVYLKNLKIDHPTMRKFWGLYNGTYQQKEDRGRQYYY